MKTITFFGIALILLTATTSCVKDRLSMPKSTIDFVELKADNYSIPDGDSTIVTAVVNNICGEMSFDWSASNGKIHGDKNEVIFNSQEVGSAVISCKVNHPGKASVTKSINISIQ